MYYSRNFFDCDHFECLDQHDCSHNAFDNLVDADRHCGDEVGQHDIYVCSLPLQSFSGGAIAAAVLQCCGVSGTVITNDLLSKLTFHF